MTSRQRVVFSLSLPPDLAIEFRRLASERGESASAFFREIFAWYRRHRLETEYASLQGYGAAQARQSGIGEEEVERIVFGDR